jgi:hypothetical protein
MEEKIFDNDWYYEKYKDVANELKKGTVLFTDGEEHYHKYGKGEGRECHYQTRTKIAIEKTNPGWTKHLTLGDYKEETRNMFVNMVDVPLEFRQVQLIEYPKGNELPFEQYFYKKFLEIKPDTFRTYLPIFWTSYFVNNTVNKDKNSMLYLNTFLKSLDKKTKYFTIVQHDDGILANTEGLDILVYSMGCKKPGYYPIPLISQPLNNNNIDPSSIKVKDIEYSFHGQDTHEIRKRLIKSLNNKHVQLKNLDIKEYYDILSRTKYALCPRGYGITSFRMFEAMAFGCVPVYISDDFWEPFNLAFTEYGIKIRPSQIDMIPEILATYDFNEMQAKCKQVYEKYFVYSQCFNGIVKTLTARNI